MPEAVPSESRMKVSSLRPSYNQFVQWARERTSDPQKINAKEVLQQYLESKSANILVILIDDLVSRKRHVFEVPGHAIDSV